MGADSGTDRPVGGEMDGPGVMGLSMTAREGPSCPLPYPLLNRTLEALLAPLMSLG